MRSPPSSSRPRPQPAHFDFLGDYRSYYAPREPLCFTAIIPISSGDRFGVRFAFDSNTPGLQRIEWAESEAATDPAAFRPLARGELFLPFDAKHDDAQDRVFGVRPILPAGTEAPVYTLRINSLGRREREGIPVVPRLDEGLSHRLPERTAMGSVPSSGRSREGGEGSEGNTLVRAFVPFESFARHLTFIRQVPTPLTPPVHLRTLSLFLVLAFASFAATPPPPAVSPSKPNILFVMADDHAAHAIGAYGSTLLPTPHIDRIAREGALLTNCFATNAVCTPSRAAILTAKYSHKNGVPTFNTFDGAQWTVAKELQRAGYHTGMIGKWHLGGTPTGFDTWRILPGQGRYMNPIFLSPEGSTEIKGYVTDVITDLSLEFLDRRPKDKPFFLMYHHKAPHGPWQPHPDDEAALAAREFTPPPTFRDDYAGRSDSARTAKMRIADMTKQQLKAEPPAGLSPDETALWKFQRYLRDYLACVAAIDRNLGRVLDYLDRHGLRDNTLVIYTSDQGFFLGEHGWYDKRFMYEESIRMPFLVRWPGVIKPGTRSDRIALNVDFAPTFLAAAGLPTPADAQGRSLLPLLRGESPADWRTTMYYRFYHTGHNQVSPHWGVRTERHKLIYFNRLDQWELFDLQVDPQEMRNEYSDSRYTTTVAALKTELTRLRTSLDDRDQFSDIQKDNP